MRGQLDEKLTTIARERPQDIPELSSIFPTIVPKLLPNITNSSGDEIHETTKSYTQDSETTLLNSEDDKTTTESVKLSELAYDNETVKDKASASALGNSSTASDESSFQSRSGLVEDIYDYTNDFGQKNPSQGSTTTEHSLPTLPPLYPRDQPHALVPFEEIKPEPSQPQSPPGGWKPNWPSDLVVPSPISVNVDGTTPSSTESIPSVFHFPSPTTVEMPVEKVPISQYFFDFSDAGIHITKIPGPLHDPTSPSPVGVPSLLPTAQVSLNSRDVGHNLPTRSVSTSSLQSSLLSTEDVRISGEPSTADATPSLSLTKGLGISEIYSSAFFPTILPTAIHSSSTGAPSQVINTVVNNDIGLDETFSSSGYLNPNESDPDALPKSPNNYSSDRNSEKVPEYSLGSDSDYSFPSAEREQALQPSEDSPTLPSDEFVGDSGDFPILPFALPSAISLTSSVISTPSLNVFTSPVAPLESRVRSTITSRKKLIVHNAKALSGEPRKPLWMLLSKSENASLKSTPTASFSDLDADIPVGIFSNKLPVHYPSSVKISSVSSSVNPSASFSASPQPTYSSSVVPTILPSLSPKLQPSEDLTSTLVSPATVTPSLQTSQTSFESSTSLETPTLLSPSLKTSVTKFTGTSNEWKPIVNETETAVPSSSSTPMSTSSTSVDVVPVLTGGFTPVVNETTSNTISSSNDLTSNMKNVEPKLTSSMTEMFTITAPLEDGFAPIAPNLNDLALTTAVQDIHSRMDLNSALLLDSPDSIVSTSPTITSLETSALFSPVVTPTPTFGSDFTFRLTSPFPDSSTDNNVITQPKKLVTISSATLGVTPKSSGTSGFDNSKPSKTSPKPGWFSRPFDYSTFENLNSTNSRVNDDDDDFTDIDTEEPDQTQTTYSRKPTTYVYPHELLVNNSKVSSLPESTSPSYTTLAPTTTIKLTTNSSETNQVETMLETTLDPLSDGTASTLLVKESSSSSTSSSTSPAVDESTTLPPEVVFDTTISGSYAQKKY